MASTIRSTRQRLGLTQAELAHLARTVGASWTQSKIAAMETGRRDISLGEALILGNLLGIGLHELVITAASSEPVKVGGVVVRAGLLKQMLEGIPVAMTAAGAGAWDEASGSEQLGIYLAAHKRRISHLAEQFGISDVPDVATSIETAAHNAAERAAARELRVTPVEVAAASLSLWGRSLTSERRSRYRRNDQGDLLHELDEVLPTQR